VRSFCEFLAKIAKTFKTRILILLVFPEHSVLYRHEAKLNSPHLEAFLMLSDYREHLTTPQSELD
jgi:hypothetical protein